MATIYKTLTNNDVTSTRTLLHEAIPITGTIVSGTYGDYGSENNVKDYSHEMFQSVYDYPYLSSSANHIFDVAVGYATSSAYDNRDDSTYHDKKVNVYNQMAQMLMGYDHTGSVRLFDLDGDLTAGDKITEAAFINFSRLLVKDEIKKGSFVITIGTGSYSAGATITTHPGAGGSLLKLGDTDAETSFKTNSPAGEYGILYEQSPSADTGKVRPRGLIFYQAGVVVLNYTGSVTGSREGSAHLSGTTWDAGGVKALGLLTGAFSPKASANAWRHRINNISFNNTVELNSTVYFCRANHNEFNYSSNPTYVSASKIRVKDVGTDAPTSYVTSVGLYSSDNELLAVAKLSEPLKKDPTNEITLRVRLDY